MFTFFYFFWGASDLLQRCGRQSGAVNLSLPFFCGLGKWLESGMRSPARGPTQSTLRGLDLGGDGAARASAGAGGGVKRDVTIQCPCLHAVSRCGFVSVSELDLALGLLSVAERPHWMLRLSKHWPQGTRMAQNERDPLCLLGVSAEFLCSNVKDGAPPVEAHPRSGQVRTRCEQILLLWCTLAGRACRALGRKALSRGLRASGPRPVRRGRVLEGWLALVFMGSCELVRRPSRVFGAPCICDLRFFKFMDPKTSQILQNPRWTQY